LLEAIERGGLLVVEAGRLTAASSCASSGGWKLGGERSAPFVDWHQQVLKIKRAIVDTECTLLIFCLSMCVQDQLWFSGQMMCFQPKRKMRLEV
jgi:hypothetical protein